MTKEALKLVLEALKLIAAQDQGCGGNVSEAEAWRSAQSIALANITAIEKALAQPEQEPVGKLQEATAERAWFTIAELNAWADKKLSENPHWAMPKDEPERDELPPQVAQPEKTVCPFCSSEWVTAEQHDRKMDRMEQERCVGCEACIDTACGRDECPKGWPKAVQPEQEPVALPCCGYTDASAVKWNPYNQVVQCHNCGQVYTTPPQRTWVGLTDEEHDEIIKQCSALDNRYVAALVEAKLKAKNEQLEKNT